MEHMGKESQTRGWLHVMHEQAAVWTMTNSSQPANSQVSSHIHIRVTTILAVNMDAASAAASGLWSQGFQLSKQKSCKGHTSKLVMTSRLDSSAIASKVSARKAKGTG